MAIADLLEKLGSGPQDDAPESDELDDIPDDLSGLDDEPDDVLTPDPKPVRKRARRISGGPVRASAAQKRQVKDALTFVFAGTGGLLSIRDPHCGGAIQEQTDATVKALVPIICRNPAMLAWFTAANAPFLDFLALATALGPVARTIWSHHVTKTIGHGSPYEGGDPVDLSAYAAPTF